MWQPKWNENQTVLAVAIHNPDRNAGPLESAAVGWKVESDVTGEATLQEAQLGQALPLHSDPLLELLISGLT